MSGKLEKHIREVYIGTHERSEQDFEQNIDAFVFHMLDWLDDLRTLADAYERSEAITNEEFEKAVISFLYHAAPHIVEAAKLYDYLPNPFHDTTKKVEPAISRANTKIAPVKSDIRIKIKNWNQKFFDMMKNKNA